MKTRVYLHASKEVMYDKGVELGLKNNALALFKYALSEVDIDLEVNPESGTAQIIAINNCPLIKTQGVRA